MELERLLRKVSSLINDRLIIDPKVPQENLIFDQ